MKALKKISIFSLLAILLFGNIVPVFADQPAEIEYIPSEYSYSGIYAGEDYDLIYLTDNTDLTLSEDGSDVMVLATGLVSKDLDGDAIEVVFGLKNLQVFESCNNNILRTSPSSYVSIEPYRTNYGVFPYHQQVYFDLFAECAGADFYVNYYKAGSVDRNTGIGVKANIPGAFIYIDDLNNAGNDRDTDYQVNQAIANYGEERLVVKNANLTPNHYNSNYVSIEQNTISALTTDHNLYEEASAHAIVDNMDGSFSSYFSARDGYIYVLMSDPYLETSADTPVKIANKTEAEAGENVHYIVRQDFPLHTSVLNMSLLIDNFYGDNATLENLKITNKNGDDITAGVSFWTLPSDSALFPNSNFYFFCDINEPAVERSPITQAYCSPQNIDIRDLIDGAVSQELANYLIERANLSQEESDTLYELLNQTDMVSVSDFFAFFNASETIATEELDLDAQTITISYDSEMPANIEQLESQVYAITHRNAGISGIGNTVIVHTKAPVQNPSTGDLSISATIALGAVASLAALVIIRKTTARH